MLTNYTPPLEAQEAISERLRYIFMDCKYCLHPKKDNEHKIDVDFALKLENEYLSEVFSWIVRGSREYYIDKKIEMPEEFKLRTQHILNDTDSIKTFIDRKDIKSLIFSSNEVYTIKEISALVSKKLSFKGELNFTGESTAGQKRKVASSFYLQSEVPELKFTSLEIGLAKVIDWYVNSI
jgi:hypothetical protein